MKAQAANKTLLFETMPIPKAVANLAVPTILSSLVWCCTIWRIRILWGC